MQISADIELALHILHVSYALDSVILFILRKKNIC